jgi:hypothetical protein
MLNRWPFVALVTAAVVIGIAGLVPRGAAQETPSELGRYSIFINTSVRADTFLLDTVSGQIWQLGKYTDLEGEPTAWSPMTRLDGQADFERFFQAYAPKVRTKAP